MEFKGWGCGGGQGGGVGGRVGSLGPSVIRGVDLLTTLKLFVNTSINQTQGSS